MSEALHDAWTRYLETVRWFGGKGAGARVTQLIPLPSYTPLSASPAVRSEIAEVSYPDGRVEHYHLLVAHYPDGAQTRPSGVVVGTDEVGGSIVQVVDAITDAAALATFVAATEPAFADRAVQVWRGEQSNTTLTLGDTDLYKLFRKVEPGPNLETEILLALDGDNVPELRGRLLAPWPDGVSTDLGMVVERIPGARDGWQLATAACAAEQDFSEEARALGEALADVHEHLARAFGTRERPGDEIADEMAMRLDAAVRDAPALAGYAAGLRASFDALRGQRLGVQRVHGDFHLGQTLASPAPSGQEGLVWTIIDFEGEPAKTAAERRAFDSPWRDVAGMLRSFDYARSAHQDPSSDAATMWADRARGAFLSGYCGAHPREDLLSGYVIDKAVYEVVYEVRNRPDWVDIPMRAIRAAAAGRAPQDQIDKE